MPQNFNRKNEISDVLKWETDPIFCRDYMEVDNTNGVTDKEFKVGECYQKSTGTKLSESVAAVPAAWTVKLSDGWAVATPEVYTIKIAGEWLADDTITIGSTTFTAKGDPNHANNQFSAKGTGDVIVQDIKKCGLTVSDYVVSYEGDKIILTQAVAGTGSAPTCTPGGSNTGTGTATVQNIQNYAPDTLTIGSTTYTVVGGTNLSANEIPAGNGAGVVARLKALSAAQSGYVLTFKDNTITFTQSSASATETPPTVSFSAKTATVITEQTASYAAAGSQITASDIDFIVLENKKVFAGLKMTVLGLMRGPAIVDINSVICADEGVDEATLKTARNSVASQLATKNIITITPSQTAVYQET